MSKNIRDLLREALQRTIDIHYAQPSTSGATLEKFKEHTRRACNLIGDVFTVEQAERRRDEVMTAKEIFVEAHKARPDRWDGCNHLSRACFLLGQLEEAAEWNQRAFDRIRTDGGEELDQTILNIRYAQHHELRAEIALAKADFQTAIQAFLRALAIDPSVHNRLSLVRVYSIISDIKSAEVQIEKLESHEDFPLWVGEFLARVLDEPDFASLRASRAWRGTGKSPGIQTRWGTATKSASARLRQPFPMDKKWKQRFGRLLRVAVLVIVVWLQAFPNITLGMHWSEKAVSPRREFTVPGKIADKRFADLRPWGEGAIKIRGFSPAGGTVFIPSVSNSSRVTTLQPASTRRAHGLPVF